MTGDDRDATLPQPRAAVRGLPLYAPDVAASIVDVSENVNLWGSPPASLRALASAPAERVNRYPTLYSTTLRDAVLGCGSPRRAWRRRWRATAPASSTMATN